MRAGSRLCIYTEDGAWQSVKVVPQQTTSASEDAPSFSGGDSEAFYPPGLGYGDGPGEDSSGTRQVSGRDSRQPKLSMKEMVRAEDVLERRREEVEMMED